MLACAILSDHTLSSSWILLSPMVYSSKSLSTWLEINSTFHWLKHLGFVAVGFIIGYIFVNKGCVVTSASTGYSYLHGVISFLRFWVLAALLQIRNLQIHATSRSQSQAERPCINLSSHRIELKDISYR